MLTKGEDVIKLLLGEKEEARDKEEKRREIHVEKGWAQGHSPSLKEDIPNASGYPCKIRPLNFCFAFLL